MDHASATKFPSQEVARAECYYLQFDERIKTEQYLLLLQYKNSLYLIIMISRVRDHFRTIEIEID